MTPAEIKKTRLYRSLAPKIRKQDREEFARMLAMVPESAKSICGMNDSSIGWAFLWKETPQGFDYWNSLYGRLNRYDLVHNTQLPEDFQP